MPAREITEPELQQTVAEVIATAQRREERYLPRGVPLTPEQREAMRPFFAARLLDGVKTLELKNERIANPAYQTRAKTRGYKLMLDFAHKAAIAHPQLIIFQEPLSLRLLFHGLVHVAQYALLGRERYLELYVRAFVQTGTYTSVPLEVQAYQLDHRYTEDPSLPFSVEDEVRRWSEAGRYLLKRNTNNGK
jgi:hypothetical protein